MILVTVKFLINIYNDGTSTGIDFPCAVALLDKILNVIAKL